MALSLDDLKKSETKRILKPKLTNKKTLDPWEKFTKNEIDSKQTANRQQIDSEKHHTSKSILINRQQIDSKQTAKATINRQQENNGVNRQRTDSKQTAEQTANRQQTDSKQTAKVVINRQQEITENISQIIGNERLFFDYIYSICSQCGIRTTPPLTISHILSTTEFKSKYIIKNLIERLTKKEALIREQGKQGRGGYIKLTIPESLFQQKRHEIDSKQTANRQQTDSRSREKQTAEQTASTPNNNNLLQKEKIIIPASGEEIVSDENQLSFLGIPSTWEEIDITGLETIKFTKGHLKQLYEKSKLPKEIIEDSLNAFAFDLNENKLIETIRTPLKMIMGLLIKGQPYNPPDNYESSKDRALRLYHERKRREADDRQRREGELIEIEYQSWTISLSKDEKESFLSDGYKKMKPESKMAKEVMNADLKSHFMETVWPEKLKEIERG